MRSFRRRSQQRREALRESIRIIARNQANLGAEETDVLLRFTLGSWAEGEITDVVNRHLNPEALFGNNHRSRR